MLTVLLAHTISIIRKRKIAFRRPMKAGPRAAYRLSAITVSASNENQNMSTIEIFVGKRKDRDRFEKIVLSRVVDWLTQHDKQAVIFCDIWLGKWQVDILVATETVTLQLEVKGWGSSVTGGQNGDWAVRYPDGTVSVRKNAYRQALENNQKLRSAMTNFLRNGASISYPQGAVLFEPEVPPNSNIDIDIDIGVDRRVLIRGSADIGDLLSTPSTSPWALSWMRDFARARRFIRMSSSEATADVQVRPLGQSPTAVPRMQSGSHDSTGGAKDGTVEGGQSTLVAVESSPSIIIPPRPPSPTRRATTTARFAAQSAVFVPANLRYSNRPSRRIARWLIRSTPILCAVFVAFYLVRASWPFGHEKPVIASASSQQTAGRHQNTRLPARHHSTPSAGSKVTHIRSVNDSANAMNGGSVNSSNRPSQPAASITCPARVDRLGCNGRIGVFSAPECPPGFVISGNTCVHAPGG